MASWSERITVPGTTRITFRADPAKMPPAVLAAVENSAFWTKCEDGLYYQNSGAFEGAKSICEDMKGGAPPPDLRRLAFESIYGPEPGPHSAKWPWQQAFRTYVDDLLPPGLTRAMATEITGKVRPYGLPGARFFRLRRTEMTERETANHVYFRVVFVHEATMSVGRYQDWPAPDVMSDEKLDDVVTAWQAAIAHYDPASFPKDAVISPRHNPDVREILENSQRG